MDNGRHKKNVRPAGDKYIEVMMSTEIKTQVVVLGAGPAGYSAAFRCADLGLESFFLYLFFSLFFFFLFFFFIPSFSLLHFSYFFYYSISLALHFIFFF
ncbi:hypothetical protein KX262_22375 [Escherichia coli]|nr:hypothetical protein [Escherichia coli]